MAAPPKQFFQVNAGRRSRTRIKSVRAINQRAGFFMLGPGIQRGKKKAGAPRTRRAINLRKRSTRQATCQHINFWYARGNRGENVAVAIGEGSGNAAGEGLLHLRT